MCGVHLVLGLVLITVFRPALRAIARLMHANSPQTPARQQAVLGVQTLVPHLQATPRPSLATTARVSSTRTSANTSSPAAGPARPV